MQRILQHGGQTNNMKKNGRTHTHTRKKWEKIFGSARLLRCLRRDFRTHFLSTSKIKTEVFSSVLTMVGWRAHVISHLAHYFFIWLRCTKCQTIFCWGKYFIFTNVYLLFGHFMHLRELLRFQYIRLLFSRSEFFLCFAQRHTHKLRQPFGTMHPNLWIANWCVRCAGLHFNENKPWRNVIIFTSHFKEI